MSRSKLTMLSCLLFSIAALFSCTSGSLKQSLNDEQAQKKKSANEQLAPKPGMKPNTDYLPHSIVSR